MFFKAEKKRAAFYSLFRFYSEGANGCFCLATSHIHTFRFIRVENMLMFTNLGRDSRSGNIECTKTKRKRKRNFYNSLSLCLVYYRVLCVPICNGLHRDKSTTYAFHLNVHAVFVRTRPFRRSMESGFVRANHYLYQSIA